MGHLRKVPSTPPPLPLLFHFGQCDVDLVETYLPLFVFQPKMPKFTQYLGKQEPRFFLTESPPHCHIWVSTLNVWYQKFSFEFFHLLPRRINFVSLTKN